MSLNIFSLLNNNFQLTNIALNFIEEDLTYNMFENTQELYENLEYFKRNYFEQATLSTHMDYVYKIYKFRKNNQGQFPTKKQFLLSFRNTCFCRYYVNDDDMFVLAAEFFLSKLGDITNLSCSNVYYFTEFFTIERRCPESIREFNLYISRSVLSILNPDYFISEIPSKPVEKSKLQVLKDKIFTFTYKFKGKEQIDEEDKEVCSVCQDDIEDNQKCIRLDCGHYFHADKNNCCENGNIFNWFQNNNSCPVCRKEV
jgi:hypothetical protein